MKRSVTLGWSSLRVGLLLVFAIVVLLWASFSGGGTSIFDPKGTFVCYFPNVNGLVTGAPVWLAGVEVGNVKSLEFVNLDPQRRVRVVCTAKRSVWDMITVDSRVQLGTIGFLGDKYVEILPGTKDLPAIESGDTLHAQEAKSAEAMFGAGREAFDDVGSMIKEVDTLLSRMNRGEGTLGRIASDEQLYTEMTRLLANLTRLSDDLHKNQERLTGSIEKMANSVGRLSDQVADNTGTLGKLMNDPALYDNLAATSARLDTIMYRINDAEGSMGLLVNDTALYVEVTNLMARINNLVTDIENNPRKYFKFSVF
jgi:phospholipid/cholesterol/gamma-HCH transport system substrate-binding protein